MRKFVQVFSLVGLCLCASSSFATDRHTDEYIEKARNLGASINKVEQFFHEEQTTMWFSIESQDYTYKNASINHAVAVKLAKTEILGCNLRGNLALFNSSSNDTLSIFNQSPFPEFTDVLGTPFNCLISFYYNTDKKFLVLDCIRVGYQQHGKGFPLIAVDAFIKFAKKHTSAQFILSDERSIISKPIADKFAVKEDKENALWSYFEKEVKARYILELS